MNIVDLPNDLFLLVTTYLLPSDLILLRCVSKTFQAAFTLPELNRQFLLQHFPDSREARTLAGAGNDKNDWSGLFAKVAARYHHLQSGTPRSLEKVLMDLSTANYRPSAPWQQHLQFEGRTANFHYGTPRWTYDDGVLIYPRAFPQKYFLYDISCATQQEIDFGAEKMVVRRIRLKEKVLVVEWCEEEAYHQLNENEMVFRHFATAYDIVQDAASGKWRVKFRNEWKIHFLGMPLNKRYRFHSAHTTTHYALYNWQPNASAWGEDDPIERLAVWDISSPSSYKPSEDPTGKGKRKEDLEGPKIIRRLSFVDLDFYLIRQRSAPRLRGLELDENHIYVIEEAHTWLIGSEASLELPALHSVRTVGIPFHSGPRWEMLCGAAGDASLSFCDKTNDARHPRFAPCWRHEDFPYLTVSEAYDAKAGVRFAARKCFLLATLSIVLASGVAAEGRSHEIYMDEELWPLLLGAGQICGDERWLIGESVDDHLVILHFDKRGQERTTLS